MIVNAHLEGWEIISHYTHGLLAGKIAMQLSHNLRPEYWEDILTAIVEHDDHQLDFVEKNYLTEAGAPLDFTMHVRTDKGDYEHAERIYMNSLQKSQMIALMVGRHLEFLYHHKIKAHQGFKRFFSKVAIDRKYQLSLYRWKKQTLEDAYRIMLFCDRCSLILCQELIPDNSRKLEINKSIDKKRYFITKSRKDVQIEPWPFEVPDFQLQYEARILNKLRFKSNKELAKEIENTDPILKKIGISRKKN